MKNQRGAFGEPRDSTKSVATVENGGAITMPTLVRLFYHVEVAITIGALVKTIDNERDALETVRRLEAKP